MSTKYAMAIFFVCPCGQTLQVEEDQAGIYVRCHGCGRLVGSPQALSVPPVPVVSVKLLEEIALPCFAHPLFLHAPGGHF